jgi:hypothetical protein
MWNAICGFVGHSGRLPWERYSGDSHTKALPEMRSLTSEGF